MLGLGLAAAARILLTRAATSQCNHSQIPTKATVSRQQETPICSRPPWLLRVRIYAWKRACSLTRGSPTWPLTLGLLLCSVQSHPASSVTPSQVVVHDKPAQTLWMLRCICSEHGSDRDRKQQASLYSRCNRHLTWLWSAASAGWQLTPPVPPSPSVPGCCPGYSALHMHSAGLSSCAALWAA